MSLGQYIKKEVGYRLEDGSGIVFPTGSNQPEEKFGGERAFV